MPLSVVKMWDRVKLYISHVWTASIKPMWCWRYRLRKHCFCFSTSIWFILYVSIIVDTTSLLTPLVFSFSIIIWRNEESSFHRTCGEWLHMILVAHYDNLLTSPCVTYSKRWVLCRLDVLYDPWFRVRWWPFFSCLLSVNTWEEWCLCVARTPPRRFLWPLQCYIANHYAVNVCQHILVS